MKKQGDVYKISFLILLVLLLSVKGNSQRAWFVKPGVDIGDTSSTISSAVLRSSSNDTILIMPGRYYESILLNNSSNLVIASLYSRDNSNKDYVANTIIDGSNVTNLPAIRCNNAWDNKLDVIGITFQNFPNQIYDFDRFTLRFERCNFYSNGNPQNPNLIFSGTWLTTPLTISNCDFDNNYGCINGRISLIKNNKFTNHSPYIYYSWNNYYNSIIGLNSDYKTKIINNLFYNNSGNSNSYIIYSAANSDSVQIINNTFLSNDINSLNINNSISVHLVQNNIFNSNIRNNASEFSFSANTKLKLFNNVTYLDLSKYTGFTLSDTTGSGDNFVFQDMKMINKENPNITTNKYFPSIYSPFLGLGRITLSPIDDIEGNLRPNPSGSAPDIGAFESIYSISTPTLVSLEANNQKVTLNWKRNKGLKDNLILIYRSTSASLSSFEKVGSINAADGTNFIDSSSVVNDLKYYYAIKAVGSVSDTSIFSNILNVVPNATNISIPSNFTGSASPARIKLSWVPVILNNDTIKYNIYKKGTNGGRVLLAYAVTNNFYVDTLVNRNNEFIYWIRAVNSYNNASAISDSIKVSTSGKVWYVSNTGNDYDIGSESFPFKTISNAISNCFTGDSVLLKRGIYKESNSYRIDSNINIISYYPFSLDSLDLKNTIVDGSNLSNTSTLVVGTATTLSFNGFSIINTPNAINNDAKTVLYKSIYFNNIYNSYTCWWCGGFSFLTTGNNSQIKNCNFSNLNSSSININGSMVFDGNLYFDNPHDANGFNPYFINLNSNNKIKSVFSNNIFNYSNNLFNVAYSRSDSIFFINNNFLFNKKSETRINSLYLSNNYYKLVIQNNIFYPKDNFSFQSNGINSSYHLFFNNNSTSTFLSANNNIEFVNIKDSSFNIVGLNPKLDTKYVLATNSPLLGKGSLSYGTNNDFFGSARIQPLNSNPDIGAVENYFSIAAPNLTTSEGSNHQIKLYWTYASNSLIDSFYLYRSDPNNNNITNQSVPFARISKDSLSYTDFSQINNLDKYYYALKTKDIYNNTSEFSNILMARANVQPEIVTSYSLSSSSGLIKLKWSHVDSNIYKYNIYKGPSLNTLDLYKSSVDAVSYIDSNISRGVTYYYMVKAVDSVGAASEPSVILSASSSGKNWYVDSAANVGGIGSYSDPFKTLNAVSYFLIPGDTVTLFPGTYKEQVVIKQKPIVYTSQYLQLHDESLIQKTVIDGSLLRSIAYLIVDSNTGGNNFTNFKGLTFTNAPSYVFNGPRINFNKAIFVNNTSNNGVFAGSYLTIDSSYFVSNGPQNYSGGCCNHTADFGDSTILRNSVFINNNANYEGVFAFNSTNDKIHMPIVEKNYFIKNNVLRNDFTLFMNTSNSVIRNNIFKNNGSALKVRGSWNVSNGYSTDIVNNTIISNNNTGFYLEDWNNSGSKFNIVNNIIQNNQGGNISFNSNNSNNPTKVAFKNNIIGIGNDLSVLKSIINIGNIDTAGSIQNESMPFNIIDTSTTNLKLSIYSNAIGRGDDSFTDITNDYYGNNRPNPSNSKPDIGAIETPFSIAGPTLKLVEGGNNKNILYWAKSNNSNTAKYFIYRSTSTIDSSSLINPIDSANNTIVSYIDSNNIVNLTKYFYRIKVIDNFHNKSAFSNEISVTPNMPLGAPDSLGISIAPRKIRISWVDTTHKANYFNIYRSNDLINFDLFATKITSSYFDDSSVLKNTTYYYLVKSVDTVGAVSDTSKTISGKYISSIFYVDAQSVSTNPIGSLLDPINKIQAAINLAKTGDTIIINPGTYYERLSIDSNIVIGSKFLLNNDTNFINNTIINGSKIINYSSFVGYKNNNYWYNTATLGFTGLTFTQFQNAFVDNNRRMKVDNCKFISIGGGCSTFMNLSDSSYIRASQFVNCGGYINLNSNCELSRSIFRNQISWCGSGLINANGSKTRINNNIFYNSNAYDIYLSGSDSNFVFHNTFYKEPNNIYQFIRFDSYNSAINYVYNNIFYKKDGQDFIFNTIYNGDSSRSVLDISYNMINSQLSENTGFSSYKSYNSRNNFIKLNPSFTNTDSLHFNLKKSSQAIGIGLDTAFLPKVDFYNTLRPNPAGSKPDLGAIESEVGVAGPEIYAITATDRLVRLSWKVIDTSGIAKYRVYKSAIDSLPTTLMFESSTQNVSSILDSIVSYDSSYSYRVKSVKRDESTSDFSDPVKINIYKSPTVVKPIDSTYYVKLADTLSWVAVNGNVNYSVEFSKSRNFIFKDSFVTKNNFIPLTNLQSNTNYYWRIKAADNIASSLWSSPYYFQTLITKPIISDTIAVLADSFKLKFNIDTTNIKFINIFKSINDSTYTLYQKILNATSFVDTLAFDRINYFKIQLINRNDKVSDTSSSVKVMTYSVPLLNLPSNNTTGLTLTPEFTWSHLVQTRFNNIQISRDTSFGSFIAGYDTIVVGKSFMIIDSNKIVPNTNYYWRVRVGDANGFSNWTHRSLFQTMIESPVFNTIKPGNKTDTLRWTLRGDSARYYKSYIYRDTVPNPTILLDSANNSTSFYIDTNHLRLNVKYYYRIKAVNIEKIISDYSINLSATPYNIKPVAKGLVDKTYKDVGIYSSVRLNQTSLNSYDVDGKIVNVKWFVNDSLVNTGDSVLVYYYKQGSNLLKMVVIDNDGDTDSTSAMITLSAFEKPFKAGFLGGITAVSPDIIYTADTSFDPINGSSISMLDRNGNSIYPLVVSSKIFTTPSVSSDSSVFITSGSSLNGFSKTGVPLWSTIPLGGLSFVTPTIDSLFSRIYVGVSNKNFFAIDYKTGKVAWNLIGDAPINASAVITGDRKLVFTSQAGTLYGFDIRTSSAQTAAKWSTNFGENVTKSPAVDSLNNLIIGTESGKVVKVKLNDDGTVSKLWTVSINAAIQTSPVIDADGYIYIGNQAGDFYKLNPDNGNILWKYSTGAAIKSTPSISEFGSIYVSNTNGVVTALNSQKAIKWTYQSDGPISANMLYIDNMLYVGTETGKFFAIYDNPATNTVNTGLSINVDPNRLKTYNYGSMASTKSFSINEENAYYYDEFKKGNFSFDFTSDIVVAKAPVWGTFQGNYRRTGSKTFECPAVPVLKIPNCIESADSIKISTSSLDNKFWVVNDVVLNTVTDTAIYVKPTDKFKVMAYNTNGCNVYSSDPLVIVNSTITKPKIVTNTGTTKFCEGDSIVLSSSISANSFKWNYLATSVDGATNKSLSTNLQGAYSVTAINEYGCKSTSDIALILSTPKAVIAPIDGNNSSCVGTILKLSNLTIGGSWSSSSASTATIDNLGNVTTLASGNTVISYTINNNGCINSSQLSFKVNASPALPKVDNIEFCVGGTPSALTASSIGGHSLMWYGTNSIGGEASGTAPIPSSSAAGTSNYYVSQVNNNTSCESPRAKIMVTVSPAPAAPSIYRDLTGNLVSSGSAGNQWYKNGIEITGANASSFKPTENANYSVKITGSCVSPMSATYFFVITDIININSSEFIKLAPNPIINNVNISFALKGYSKLNIDVFNLSNGTKVASKKDVYSESSISFESLSAGVYLFEVYSTDGKISYQFKMVKL